MREAGDRRPRLSTVEVSKLFDVNRVTLYRWIREGVIPEPARDPDSGWPIWQQPDLDAIARALQARRKK